MKEFYKHINAGGPRTKAPAGWRIHIYCPPGVCQSCSKLSVKNLRKRQCSGAIVCVACLMAPYVQGVSV